MDMVRKEREVLYKMKEEIEMEREEFKKERERHAKVSVGLVDRKKGGKDDEKSVEVGR